MESPGAEGWWAVLRPWLPWLAAVVVVALLREWWYLRHFARCGLPWYPALPIIGSMGGVALRRYSIAEFVLKVYAARGKASVVGFFDFPGPITAVCDPALLREVGVKRFDYFRNHRPLPTQKTDLFSRSLFALKDQHWKDMRATMSPAFTTSKMRVIFQLISKCGRQSTDFLEKRCQELSKECKGVYEVEFKDFYTRFATDVIATSAFGVECDSIGQPNNEFYVMGKEITNFGGIRAILFLIVQIAPKLAQLLGVSFISQKAGNFFRSLVRDALTQRKERGIYRPDVLQLMMEARDGHLGPQLHNGQPRIEMSEEDIVSQAVLFFFAGFDTVSNLICFTCYLLALHPDVQDRLQCEIDEAQETNGGELSYEAVQQMKYLDMVVNETLRMYPPAPAIDRLCTNDVEIPAGDGYPTLSFRKGDVLWLPIIGIQRDERFWPEPEKFDPERFNDENKHKINPFTYIPFGVGPRVCLAQRFAVLEAKVALVHLLGRLTLSRVERTRVPVRLSTRSFNTASADGYWCGVSLRNQRSPRKPLGVAA